MTRDRRDVIRHDIEWLVENLKVSDASPRHVTSTQSAVRIAVHAIVKGGLSHDQAREAADAAERAAIQLEQQAEKQDRGSAARADLVRHAYIAWAVAAELRTFS